MKIKLDLYQPYQMRAFANFLTEVAAGLDAERSNPPFGCDAPTGEKPSDHWRNRQPEEIKTGVVAVADETIEGEVAEMKTLRDNPPAEEPAKPTRTRRTKAQIEAEAKAEEPAKLAISTGEERIDPAAEADAEQDAADEAAEHTVAEVEAAPLTHNDLRNAMGAYVKAFGMAETLEDGPGIMVAALGAPPAGADVWTASAVPVDKLGLAINAWLGAAVAGKRFGA